MDTGVFRWVLIAIAIGLAIAVYAYGRHQSKLRNRNAIDTFTREEFESEEVDDEQLRDELDHLTQILQQTESDAELSEVRIDPIDETTNPTLENTLPEFFTPSSLQREQPQSIISYYLYHDDYRLIPGEEAAVILQQGDLHLNAEGFLEFQQQAGVLFQIASLSPPGDFNQLSEPAFFTLGLHCFIDLKDSDRSRQTYEAMLQKIDELVQLLGVKVYKPNRELLNLTDVTDDRERLVSWE